MQAERATTVPVEDRAPDLGQDSGQELARGGRVPSYQQLPAEKLPSDFAGRLGAKLIVTYERARSPEQGLNLVARMIVRNLSQVDRWPLFVDMVAYLLKNMETLRYVGLCWLSLVQGKEDEEPYRSFVENLLQMMIDQHRDSVRPAVQLGGRRQFSFFAAHMGEVCIGIMNASTSGYEVIGLVYSKLIRREMHSEMERHTVSRSKVRELVMAQQSQDKAVKRLYNEIIDYVHHRSQFRSEALTQQNPNEFISELAERLRNTRRYVIQDVIQRQAQQKRLQAERELRERPASAEDIVAARNNFKEGLKLFWFTKRFNYTYMAVERVRVTMQVFALALGVFYFLMGYLQVGGVTWWEGMLVCAGMTAFAWVFISARAFARFYPENRDKELEILLGNIIPSLRRLDYKSFDRFLINQVKDPENESLLFAIPEFVRYLFAVMPNRREVAISMEELRELLDTLDLDIARYYPTVKAQPA